MFVQVVARNLTFVCSASMMNTIGAIGTSSISQYRCRLTVGGFYNPLPLRTSWFGMALNMADPPHECANGMEVGRERVLGPVWKRPLTYWFALQ